MSVYAKATVKYGKEKAKNIPLSGDDGASICASLRTALQAKFSVPSDRQKILCRGKILTSDNIMDCVKKGKTAKLTLIGSAAPIKEAAVPKIQFVEDMSAAGGGGSAAMEELIPPGLDNVGNTCYLNATVQAMKAIPDVNTAMVKYADNGGAVASAAGGGGMAVRSAKHRALARTFGQLLSDMNKRHNDSVRPLQFVSAVHQFCPQFAQPDPRTRGPMQQDAYEFFQEVHSALLNEVDKDGNSLPSNKIGSMDSLGGRAFGIGWEEVLTCPELDSARAASAGGADNGEGEDKKGNAISSETVSPSPTTYVLRCNISGGVSQGKNTVQVNYLKEGLKLAMNVSKEKNCPELGRNALFTGHQRIVKLPKYLVVMYVRFFFKATPNSRERRGVATKIVRAVKFDTKMDVADFCSPKLLKKLQARRAAVEARREEAMKQKLGGGGKDGGEDAESGGGKEMENGVSKAEKEKAMDVDAGASGGQRGDDDDVMDEDLQAALAMSLEDASPAAGGGEGGSAPFPSSSSTLSLSSAAAAAASAAGEDEGMGLEALPANFCGTYDLISLVTHKGRSASSGHYIGYAKDFTKVRAIEAERKAAKKTGKKVKAVSEPWLKFDDDVVYESDADEIKKLCGGGDREMVYLAFYQAVGEDES